MRCSWLHRLLGRIAPRKPGNAAVVRRRLRSAAAAPLALPSVDPRRCRSAPAWAIPPAQRRRRLLGLVLRARRRLLGLVLRAWPGRPRRGGPLRLLRPERRGLLLQDQFAEEVEIIDLRPPMRRFPLSTSRTMLRGVPPLPVADILAAYRVVASRSRLDVSRDLLSVRGHAPRALVRSSSAAAADRR